MRLAHYFLAKWRCTNPENEAIYLAHIISDEFHLAGQLIGINVAIPVQQYEDLPHPVLLPSCLGSYHPFHNQIRHLREDGVYQIG